ncbi:DUF4179 domain-containing protein [Clostridium sp.]|uniref:DUF4179 domain-containing protein n=1 Tax=Clostridium sp. TaxID=1506 RepID=UPI00346463B9
MEDKLIDKLIKEELNDESLPDIVNEKVNEALLNICKDDFNKEVKKEKKFNRGRVLKIAIVCLCLLGSTGIIYNKEIVSYAKEFIGTVFGYMKDERMVNDEFDKYSNKPMIEAKDKGITVRITDIISDGVSVKFGYMVENNNVKDSSGNIDSIYAIDPLINYGSELYINGKEMFLESGWAMNNQLSNKVTIISESHKFKERLPEKFQLEWRITNIKGTKGNWNLKVQVDSNDLMKETKVVKVNEDYTIGELKYHVKEVRYTPISNFIDITAEAPKDYSFDKKGEEGSESLLVTDEEGVVIQQASGMYSEVKGDKAVISYVLDSPIEKYPKKINIVPYTGNSVEHYIGEKLNLETLDKITIDME